MFRNILLNLLQEKGITQKELSRKTQIPPTTISGWLNANRLPDYTALIKLTLFFNVKTEYLLGIEDELGKKII